VSELTVIGAFTPAGGGEPLIIAIDEEGRFGLAGRPIVGLGAGLAFTSPPLKFDACVAAAQGVLEGRPRMLTQPGGERTLAIGLMAAAWKIAELADVLDAQADALRGSKVCPACGETFGPAEIGDEEA